MKNKKIQKFILVFESILTGLIIFGSASLVSNAAACPSAASISATACQSNQYKGSWAEAHCDCDSGDPALCTGNESDSTICFENGGSWSPDSCTSCAASAGGTGTIPNGQSCNGNASACESAYCNSSGNCDVRPSGADGTPGGGAGGTSGDNSICDTSNGYELTAGGLCVPKSPFNSGIASEKTLSGLISTILKILLTLAGVIAVVFIIIGGFRYMTAGGNAEQAEKGRQSLINAIIGLVVIILAYTIVTVITNAVTSNSVLGN